MEDVAVHEQTGIRYYNPEKAYYEAEDRECAMMALDKAGVPRADDAGKVFSLWGRIMRFKEMPSNAEVNGGRLADRPSEAV